MSRKKIKILTVNTHKGFNWFNRKFILHELREAIRGENAEVVFLQEVLGEHSFFADQYATLWPEASQYEFLAEDVWPSHAYGRNAVYPHGHHGNALLSRYPINQWHNYDISLDGIEKRGLLYCHINVPDHSLHTICVHLSLREHQRQEQVNHIVELVNRFPSNEPLVLAGDFNDWREKAHKRLLEETELVEVAHHHWGRPARTFPAAIPLLRLDRIYVKNAHKIKLVNVPYKPWSKLSDHKPLMLELTL